MPPSPRKSIRRYSPTIELSRRELLMARSSEGRGARAARPLKWARRTRCGSCERDLLLARAARCGHQLAAVLDGHGEGEHYVARARAGEEDAYHVAVVVEDRPARVAGAGGADRELVSVAQFGEGVGLVERVLVAAQ